MGVSRQTAGRRLRRSRSGRRSLRPEQPPAQAGEAHAGRSRGAGRRRQAGAAARAARACRRDGGARAHVRADRREARDAQARRRRPRDRRGPAARARHPRALRAREARGAGPRGRQEGRENPGRRRLEGPRGISSSRTRTRAQATPACTSPWTTAAASPTRSCCPTRRRAPAPRSWAARCASTRGWAWPSSA